MASSLNSICLLPRNQTYYYYYYYLKKKIFCRSDPTENDSVEGLRPNARGPGLVTFGVFILHFFLKIFYTCDQT